MKHAIVGSMFVLAAFAAVAEQDSSLLYYFPLEGSVKNVGGSGDAQYVTVGDSLTWKAGAWSGSPFATRTKSLCSASAETKVYCADGLVPAESRWTLSLWLNASQESENWCNACGFQIGEKKFRFQKIEADTKSFQIYGTESNEYLQDENEWAVPIVCGDAWVNVSVSCNAELDGFDVYVNGAYLASMDVANADKLTGIYLTGASFGGAAPKTFVDEVSLWSRALEAEKLEDLAKNPTVAEIPSDDPQPDPTVREMLYYFPLEGSVENVGGTRGSQDLSVGEELTWNDGEWKGSPFGSKSLRSSSAETKIYNANGLVASGSRWTISFWVNSSQEEGGWKDVCGFQVGDQIYNFERTDAKAVQLYGKPGDYLHGDDMSDKPIVCGDDWVNVSVVCNADLNGVDVYANGQLHGSVSIAQADKLTGFYFSAYGLRTEPVPSMVFVDEVSVWSYALDADQLAHLAANPVRNWTSVTESTPFAEVPGLTDGQREGLAAKDIAPIRVAQWAEANRVSYGAGLDLEAFAMNCAPAAKADEAAKLKLTIAMDGEDPVVGIVTDADGEPVTKDWNIQPTIKGKSDLADEAWGDRNAEGVRFFKAFLDL